MENFSFLKNDYPDLYLLCFDVMRIQRICKKRLNGIQKPQNKDMLKHNSVWQNAILRELGQKGIGREQLTGIEKQLSKGMPKHNICWRFLQNNSSGFFRMMKSKESTL